jgi:membrane protease YdiL (CAAX protease family)
VLSSLAFAAIHLPRTGDPRALMTFFPGLVFGWMRSSTGSLLPSVLMHASSNVLIYLLDHAAQRW